MLRFSTFPIHSSLPIDISYNLLVLVFPFQTIKKILRIFWKYSYFIFLSSITIPHKYCFKHPQSLLLYYLCDLRKYDPVFRTRIASKQNNNITSPAKKWVDIFSDLLGRPKCVKKPNKLTAHPRNKWKYVCLSKRRGWPQPIWLCKLSGGRKGRKLVPYVSLYLVRGSFAMFWGLALKNYFVNMKTYCI